MVLNFDAVSDVNQFDSRLYLTAEVMKGEDSKENQKIELQEEGSLTNEREVAYVLPSWIDAGWCRSNSAKCVLAPLANPDQLENLVMRTPSRRTWNMQLMRQLVGLYYCFHYFSTHLHVKKVQESNVLIRVANY